VEKQERGSDVVGEKEKETCFKRVILKTPVLKSEAAVDPRGRGGSRRGGQHPG